MPEAGIRIGCRLAALAVSLLAALLLAPGRAEATITSCTMTATDVVFSPYDTQTQTAVDSTGTIEIECFGDGTSNNTSLHIGFGTQGGGTCTSRRMGNGTNRLSYQIYKTAARNTVFCASGDRMPLTFNLGTGSQKQTIIMYGRVAAAQNPVYAATPYTDVLTLELRNGNAGGLLRSVSTTVSSMVAAICTVSAGSLGFGSYSGTAVDATASVSVNCSNGAPYSIVMGGGNNQSGSLRRMAGPAGNFLGYQLFRDSARSLAWGDNSAQLGATRGGTGSGTAQSISVYGRIPGGQNPVPGSYSDTVLVTVDY